MLGYISKIITKNYRVIRNKIFAKVVDAYFISRE